MTLRTHDFSQPMPLSPEVRKQLAQWLGRANKLLGENLSAMGVSVEIVSDDPVTTWPSETLSKWTDATLAYRVCLPTEDSPSIFALPNPLAQVLIGRLLGDQFTEEPAERSLSQAEAAIGEFVIATMLQAMSESWVGETPPGFRVGEREANLRRTKRFVPSEAVVTCRSNVKTPVGTSYWCWMMSKAFLAKMFGLPSPTGRSAAGPTSRHRLESLVRSMRAEIAVRLGSVQLTAPQLSALRVGDVVMLDQRADKPLQATVRGEPKFLGWPGRVGNRQGFEISLDVIRAMQGNNGSEAFVANPG